LAAGFAGEECVGWGILSPDPIATSSNFDFHVGALPVEEFKIVNAVIVSDAVFMMHDFLGREESAEMLFHDKAMFKDVAGPSSGGMVRAFNQGVAVGVNKATAFPPPVLLHRQRRELPLFWRFNAAPMLVSVDESLWATRFQGGGWKVTMGNDCAAATAAR
jgi:hypothetical protein